MPGKSETSRKSIWVMMGGPSTEHKVSLVSGRGMVQKLDQKKYLIYPVILDQAGHWIWRQIPLSENECQTFDPQDILQSDTLPLEWKKQWMPSPRELPAVDFALLAFHGSFGEDGRIQGILDCWGIKYSGSGVLGSALALDKIKSKEIYKIHQLPTPDYCILNKKADYLPGLEAFFKQHQKIVLKNPTGGSSLGMGISDTWESTLALTNQLFCDCETLLCEEFLQGQEATCGFIEGLKALPPTEIIPNAGSFFDFEAKYQGKSLEITPGRFSPSVTQKLQSYAKKAHQVLGLEIYSRTDFLILEESIYLLETNTLPGFTPSSLLPQGALEIGLDYSALLDTIIELSLKKAQAIPGLNIPRRDYAAHH